MDKRRPDHFIKYNEWVEWNDYENYIFNDEKNLCGYDAYKDTPSKEECDRICEELSGDVISYFI